MNKGFGLRSVALSALGSRRFGEPLGSLPVPGRPRRRLVWTKPVPEPAPNPDAIDKADAMFRNAAPLEELMAGVAPITSWGDLDIPDLTDEEREALAAALDE